MSKYRWPKKGDSLTLFELDVLNAMAGPFSYPEIAAMLGRSVQYTKNAVWSIYKKLGLPISPGGKTGTAQRAEAVRIGKARRLI